MPQGFKNSPAVFQRAMTLMFKDVIGVKCIIYTDDILVFGKTKEEHDDNLAEILSIMNCYGLKENVDKRVTCQETVSFLGYKIQMNKISPDLNRAQGIIEYERPKTKKALQRFIGIINYDRMFVKNITEILSPLYNLLQKENKFEWKEIHDVAFENAKKKWTVSLELKIADPNVLFVVETDASNVGVGAVLKQKDQAIAYISRSLTKSELNYIVNEKEMLAVVWALEKFRYYLTGRHFTLITDHKALEELKTQLEFGSFRVQRWFDKLARYDFVVKYMKGEELVEADALSRAPSVEICSVVDIERRIMEVHKKSNHRKTIKEELEKEDIDANLETVKKVLRSCRVCQKKR
jgi:hypothetical protein